VGWEKLPKKKTESRPAKKKSTWKKRERFEEWGFLTWALKENGGISGMS